MSKTKSALGVSRALASSDFLHGVEHFWLEDSTRPIEVMAASVVGIVGPSEDADAEIYPLNKAVLINSDKQVAKAGVGPLGSALRDIYRQKGALCVVVRTPSEAIPGSAQDPIVGEVDGEGNASGLQALLAAESSTGVRPTILMVASAGDSDLETHTPALEAVANKLHAIPVIGMSKGGPTAAMAEAEKHDGTLVVYGECYFGKDATGAPLYRPFLPTAVGHIMRVDAEEGYWNSPSSRKILGLSGMRVPVDHALGSSTSTANLLNAANVCCVVGQKGGFYFYGNRLTGPKSMVIPHQRIRYIVGLSIMESHQELVDRNVTANYVEGVKGRVNNLLRRMVLREVISGGECWVDQELNQSMIGTNQVVWDYDLGFYDVAERCTFRQHVNRSYNEAIFA
ncbi:phage tail sheath C-terminal domain-containing protein [Aeromonas aquatica]|uniref:phage tail sheath C-terminal domain-containing protein n=1 Tax=Aeromonas aquatica TaxID=558964 RepID=UPI00051BFBD8|nr:phage tail sheath C-terminal domain-containing protein [Aeromonas aquatica]